MANGRFTAIVWLAAFMSSVGAASAASDIVITTTGDRLVGEIKKVEKDVLTLSTDYSDSDFKIKWDKISHIQSDRQFLLETFAGKRIAGTLKPEGEQKGHGSRGRRHERDVARDLGRAAIRAQFRVAIRRGVRSRLQQDAGERRDAVLVWRQPLLPRPSTISISLFVNVFRSSQSNAPDTNRWDLGNDFRRLLGDRW